MCVCSICIYVSICMYVCMYVSICIYIMCVCVCVYFYLCSNGNVLCQQNIKLHNDTFLFVYVF